MGATTRGSSYILVVIHRSLQIQHRFSTVSSTGRDPVRGHSNRRQSRWEAPVSDLSTGATIRGASDIPRPVETPSRRVGGVSHPYPLRRSPPGAGTVVWWRDNRDLLRTPGVARMIAAQLTARFPNGMMSLAILLHVEQQTGSYGSAGSGARRDQCWARRSPAPVTSRWMGVWGMRRVITLTLSVCVVAVLCLALLPLEVPGYMALGMVAGLSTPPVQAAGPYDLPQARELVEPHSAVLPRRLAAGDHLGAGPRRDHARLHSDRHRGGTAAGWRSSSSAAERGSSSPPRSGRVRIPRSRNALGKVVLKPPVLLATVIGFLLIGACAAVEVGVVATVRARKPRRRSRARRVLGRKPRRRSGVRTHPHRAVGHGAPAADRDDRARP